MAIPDPPRDAFDRNDDVLPGDVGDRVLAHDVVVVENTVAEPPTAYWALWVLAWRPGGGQELHLFISNGPSGNAPTFIPYSGNPVLLSNDSALCGASTDCSLSSFTVASFNDAGRQRLRMLFARSRYAGGMPVHDLVALEQPAPEGLIP
jgi:hypothetical protein